MKTYKKPLSILVELENENFLAGSTIDKGDPIVGGGEIEGDAKGVLDTEWED